MRTYRITYYDRPDKVVRVMLWQGKNAIDARDWFISVATESYLLSIVRIYNYTNE